MNRKSKRPLSNSLPNQQDIRSQAVNDVVAFLTNISKVKEGIELFGQAQEKIGNALKANYDSLRSKRALMTEIQTKLSLNQPLDPATAKGLLSDSTRDVNLLATRIENLLPDLIKGTNMVFEFMAKALKFKEAFGDDYKEGIYLTLYHLENFHKSIKEHEQAMLMLQELFSDPPPQLPQFYRAALRLSKAFEKTKDVYASMVAKNKKTREKVYERISIIDQSVEQTSNQELDNINILFLSADPSDITRLMLGKELREIQEKIQLASQRENFYLSQRMAVRPADVTQALLDEQPNIVHFSGHGSTNGSIYLENESGKATEVQPEALSALFELVADQTFCVILNACYSEIQAKAIAKHIKYVIGMKKAIDDKAAIAFSIGFYQALGAGKSVPEAFRFGCVQIRLQGIPEYGIPILVSN